MKNLLTRFWAWYERHYFLNLTIAGGLFHISFSTLIIASLVGRGIRFFGVALVMYLFGARIEGFIKKYFNILTILFFILIALGFIAIKYFF